MLKPIEPLGDVPPLDLGSLRKSRSLTHAVFRFPGKFHPALVTDLIKRHPRSHLVGDPMVGCGTTAVETVVAGRDGFFSDIDPLSCLLARAKSRPVDPSWLVDVADKVISDSRPFAKPGVRRGEARQAIHDLESTTEFRAPPQVFHWFRPYVVANLCRLLGALEELELGPRRRDALLAIVASITRRVSRADPHTVSGLEVTSLRLRELAAGLRFDVAAEFRRKALQMAGGYREIRKVTKIGKAQIVQGDARKWGELCKLHKCFPDLVITSPCYLSAIEYWRRHKLEYCWLGLVKPEELAHMRRRFLGMGDEESSVEDLPPVVQQSHATLINSSHEHEAKELARYFDDSRDWLRALFMVLQKSDGVAYVVAGPNTVRGTIVDTPGILRILAKEVGFVPKVHTTYRIKNSHMQYPTKGNVRIRNETVLKLSTN